MKTVMKKVCAALAMGMVLSAGAGERYSYVREFKVDGRDVRLGADETNLDLTKIYPDAWKPGCAGTRWVTVEATVESDADKTVRFYFSNEWFGELFVNGACVKGDMGGPADAMASIDIPLRKGTNAIALRTRAGNCGWHCAFAFDGVKRPGETDCEVDFTKTAGRIRPLLHSSGFGPLVCSCPRSTVDEIRSMNFAAARTHDWALINPNERVCDYFHVFPLMRLDATKAENYHFGPTDYLLKRTREEAGLDVFYRLGTSIEHSGEKIHFNTLIPEDFDKVAEIFAGTIRHYNRGWANGFNWGIRYWELWNEPDGCNNMWCLPDGDGAPDSKEAEVKDVRRRELFVRFFVTCLKRLKSEFPDVKVGGPAMCSMNEPYFKALLEGCRAAGVAPDFISWHYYGNSVEAILGSVARARKLCDDMGFGACELVLNEWHYMGCGFPELRSADPKVQDRVWNGPSSHNGTDSAAFTLSVLARFQASALDQGYYYGCRHSGAWGYKDERKHLYKTYYALKAFGEIVKGYPVLGEVKTTGTLTTLVAKSADGRRTALLAVDYCGLPGDVVIGAKGLPGGRPTAKILDHVRNFEPVDVRVEGDRLVLPKQGRDSASYLVTWERDGEDEYDVRNFGAKGDGTTLDTAAIQKTIEVAAAEGGGTVVVPAGTYLSGALFFRKGTKLRLDEGAVIRGSTDIRDYPEMMTRIEGETCPYYPALVNADGVDGFSVDGKGTLDGSGYVYWCRLIARSRRIPGTENKDEPRPRLLYVSNAKHVSVRGITLRNSAYWTTHFYRCEDVTLEDLRIYTEVINGVAGENPDAVDLDAVRTVRIRRCFMDVPNDAITLKGGKGPTVHDPKLSPESGPVEDVLVEDCTFGAQCTGCLTFGSECFRGKDVTVRDCTVANVKAVLRLKMRPDTKQDYGPALVEGIRGTAEHALVIAPYTSHARPEWKTLHLESVARDITVRLGAGLRCLKDPSVLVPSSDYRVERVVCE